MLKRGVLFIYGLLVCYAFAYADIADTIIVLDEVVAKGVKFDRYSIGAKIIRVDSFTFSTNKLNSIAELLAGQSAVTLTSYGVGGQASIKIRGGGADHTTVIWNGLNLKPPMSGEINYSASNVGQFDNIVIQPGGASTMYGTGAATGVIFLSNDLSLNNSGYSGSVTIEGGSYNSTAIQTIAGYSGEKYAGRISFSRQSAENDFSFKYGKKTKTQEHAAFQTINIAQQNAFLIGQHSKVETDFWYVNHFKEVPALTSDTKIGTSEQEDNNLRMALNYSLFRSGFSFKYRAGFLADNIYYVDYDTLIGFDSRNKSHSIINEIETKFTQSRFYKLYIGLNNTLEKGSSDYYTSEAHRNLTAVFGRLNSDFFKRKLNVSLEVRQEMADFEAIPLVYSIGSSYSLIKQLSVKGQFSKLYSLPDMNDLYWAEDGFSTGNPDLIPEYGWNAEVGLDWNITKTSFSLKNSLTVYTNQMKDAIIWMPDSVDGKWMPNNYEGSESNGIEFSGSYGIKRSKSRYQLSYGYSYTDAQIIESDESEEGSQKIYIPKHQSNMALNYTYKRFSTGISTSWVGERLIDEVSLPLDSYMLMDFSLNYTVKLTNTSLSTTFKIRNLTDTDYVVLAGYAQAPRSYYAGISYTF